MPNPRVLPAIVLLICFLVARPAAGGVKAIPLSRFLPRPCTLAFIAAGLLTAHHFLNDDGRNHTPIVVTAGNRAPVAETQHKNRALFQHEDEVVLGTETTPPSILIFQRNFIQKQFSTMANDTVYNEEKKPELKKLLHQGEGLEVALHGLVLRKSPIDPEKVEVVVVGPTRELAIKELVSLKDLEDEKPIDRALPKVGRDFGALGSAVGSGRIKFHYDREKGVVVVDEFSADFKVKSFGLTQPDSGKLTGLTLVRKDLQRKPATNQKWIQP